MKSLLFLGRQPKLGLAELESLYGSDALTIVSDTIVGTILPVEDINFARIGGSFKLANILGTLTSSDWKQIEKALEQSAVNVAKNLDEGKINLGISVYGQAIDPLLINRTSMRLKKAIRAATGKNSRTVPNSTSALSSAQVFNNHLTNERGLELVVVFTGNETLIAQTYREQDINGYAKRDQNRPKRDARVGMLPPKLAQIIINLATGDAPTGETTVLDPFCGTGVLLQEAALMGYNIYGTDIEQRMIDYSHANLLWLNETHKLSKIQVTLDAGDATNYTWPEPFTVIAAEGYLGQPFTGFPTPEKLTSVTNTCNLIAKEFLKNLAPQIPSGTRICIGLPAWHRPNGEFVHLKLLDSLENLGYNRVSFEHVRSEDLMYYREDQIVARELVVITRN